MNNARDIIKNAIGMCIYLIYYSVCLFVFASEIFTNSLYLVTILINYLILFVDALVRPESEEEEPSRAEIIMALAFLLQPFMVILVFYENLYFISEFLIFWDNPLLSYVGILILITGGLVLLVSRIQLGMYGSGKIVLEEEHELITRGIYNYIRHPIYLGGLIGWIGISLALRGLITLFLFLVMYFLILKNRMDLEEQLLQKAFGEEYLSYMKRTKRIILFFY
jgi:protein-S-isoprenylcysteine O-methyltransferase Ste14